MAKWTPELHAAWMRIYARPQPADALKHLQPIYEGDEAEPHQRAATARQMALELRPMAEARSGL